MKPAATVMWHRVISARWFPSIGSERTDAGKKGESTATSGRPEKTDATMQNTPKPSSGLARRSYPRRIAVAQSSPASTRTACAHTSEGADTEAKPIAA
ncbi:hypothetical protein Poly59_61270 [Rubripirellula reticaptiva]|uniref:Uncharacterized protein n=1 Tax=Rubripirellula reticaptiva TaxID=2528013 RepID=A0A5C6E7J7_9BACT|nr:hypothetical protein Poly59_61270 [Rubripirellula reticaptiva]